MDKIIEEIGIIHKKRDFISQFFRMKLPPQVLP